MKTSIRTVLATGTLSLAALVGCTADPAIINEGEEYRLNDTAREFLADSEKLNSASTYNITYNTLEGTREPALQELSESEIDAIPQEFLARGYPPDPSGNQLSFFKNWADEYVSALRACGTNDELLKREGFRLAGRQVLCERGVPADYSSAFAELGPLREYRAQGIEEGPDFAETVANAHHAEMTLQDFTEYEGIWDDEEEWYPYGWRRVAFFREGLSGNEYVTYPERFWNPSQEVGFLYTNGITGSQAAQWGDCLNARGIVALSKESYPHEKTHELCAIAEEHGVRIYSDDMLWFEEQGVTPDQVRTAIEDEYRAIRERLQ